MTVYVDDMYRYPMGEVGRMRMSHMIADTDDELHAMAAAIGIARRWFQARSHPHYDIGIGKRDQAIQRGAVPVPMRLLATMVATRRRVGVLPRPEDCIHFNVQMAARGYVVIRRTRRAPDLSC
jgi:Protein of unknown function (DUF4031)